MRDGKWKLVRRRCDDAGDLRGEERCGDGDLDSRNFGNSTIWKAIGNWERVKRMAKEWLEWASPVGAKSWPLNPLPNGERD